eukprot:2625284-Rhodomonas_salina.2
MRMGGGKVCQDARGQAEKYWQRHAFEFCFYGANLVLLLVPARDSLLPVAGLRCWRKVPPHNLRRFGLFGGASRRG